MGAVGVRVGWELRKKAGDVDHRDIFDGCVAAGYTRLIKVPDDVGQIKRYIMFLAGQHPNSKLDSVANILAGGEYFDQYKGTPKKDGNGNWDRTQIAKKAEEAVDKAIDVWT